MKKLAKIEAKLYLIPTTLGNTDLDRVLPNYNHQIISGIEYFIVENIRTARRFLKKIDPNTDIDSLHFFELNKHTEISEFSKYLSPIKENRSIGVISEAGCPAIADPGADIVALAHQMNIQVVPLVGPSSILLSLMASGFNGQSFAFYGYLPIDNQEKINIIKRLEGRIYGENQTQIFIETPYRNNKLIEDLISICRPTTKLCIACDISLNSELIITKTIRDWKKEKVDIHKRPAVFLIYK